jgi:hypothetical protein
MSDNPLVTKIEHDARALAESLREATDAGIGPAIILPTLITVFREAGIMSDFQMPSLPSLMGGGE